MVAKRFDNVKAEIQAKTGRTWDQIQDMRSRVKQFRESLAHLDYFGQF